MSKTSREKFETWGISDADLRITLQSETYAGIAWMAWQAATEERGAEVSALEQQIEESQSKLAQLAADNAGLKNALEWLYETVSSESVSIPDEKYSSVTNAAQVLSKTPATDAFLAEVRASGLEMFAERKHNEMMSLHPDTHAVGAIAAEMSSQVKQLREFAAQLRQEGTAKPCPHCGGAGTCSEHGCTATDLMLAQELRKGVQS